MFCPGGSCGFPGAVVGVVGAGAGLVSGAGIDLNPAIPGIVTGECVSPEMIDSEAMIMRRGHRIINEYKNISYNKSASRNLLNSRLNKILNLYYSIHYILTHLVRKRFTDSENKTQLRSIN